MAPAGTLVQERASPLALTLKPNNSEQLSLCAGPLRGHLGLQQPSVSHNPIPADFHSQILWGFLFLALMLWAEETGVGLRSLTPQGGP